MRQIWTIIQYDGPNSLGLCLIQASEGAVAAPPAYDWMSELKTGQLIEVNIASAARQLQVALPTAAAAASYREREPCWFSSCPVAVDMWGARSGRRGEEPAGQRVGLATYIGNVSVQF